jgi:hypothetical protein
VSQVFAACQPLNSWHRDAAQQTLFSSKIVAIDPPNCSCDASAVVARICHFLVFTIVCRQQLTYQISAIAATTGVSALAVLATYYKLCQHMTGPEMAFPWLDMAGTLALVFGGVVGMEMWARWAHKALWHDAPGGWALHKSHHEPRVGPFEVRSNRPPQCAL